MIPYYFLIAATDNTQPMTAKVIERRRPLYLSPCQVEKVNNEAKRILLQGP
jgi:hypothetical protein